MYEMTMTKTAAFEAGVIDAMSKAAGLGSLVSRLRTGLKTTPQAPGLKTLGQKTVPFKRTMPPKPVMAPKPRRGSWTDGLQPTPDPATQIKRYQMRMAGGTGLV